MKKSHIWIMSCTVIVLIITMFFNTFRLGDIVKQKTDQYVQDVSEQSADDISYFLRTNVSYIEQLANTIDRMPRITGMNDFLQRKADAFQFDVIAIVDQNRDITKNDTQCDSFDTWISRDAVSYENMEILSLDQHALLISIPMQQEKGNEKVLVGVREQDSLQHILSQANFHGDGMACIVDKNGQIVVPPADAQAFSKLKDILQQPDDTMLQNIDGNESGMLYFKAESGEKRILSYNPLAVNGWSLVTLVHQDLISGDIEVYEYRSFVIVFSVSAVFIIFIILIVLTYERNRKRLIDITMVDPLTGGDNNLAFQIKLEALLSKSPPSAYTLVFLNIKGFKMINETFGVGAGDDTLQYVYEKLKENLTGTELVCRSEMDHFFLCLKENTEDNADKRLREILADINSYNEDVGVPYNLMFALGGYLIDDPHLDIRIMQDHARFAGMRRQEGGVCSFFGYALIEQMKKETLLDSMFETSVKNRDFQVYLQPKVCLPEMKPCGCEALVRWIHPEFGMINPSAFIPLFEKNENICILDLYVFEEVCKFIRKNIRDQKEIVPISVNVSRIHFRKINFLHDFIEIKEKYGIPDNIIELEITESILMNMEQISLIKNIVNEMHAHGFLCSLDDFGFGYSSLSLLKEFEIDVIKLDKIFFDDISNQKSQYIIQGLIDIAHKLGMKVVAEGIETREQLKYLCDLRCDMVQGYIFSKPLPVPDFEAWCKGEIHIAPSANV